jgi:alanine racemase
MFDLHKIRPVWLEVDLDAIRHNVKEIRRITKKDALLTAIVKSDGYGHGAITVSKVMLESGVDRLGVAFIDEAIELRNAGITAPILITGYTEHDRAEEVVKYNLDVSVYTLDAAAALSDAAAKHGAKINVHIKVDTGMGRIGLLPTEESIDIVSEIFKLPHLIFDGLFTHYATADFADKTYTWEQYRRFNYFVDELKARGLVPNLYHCANSSTIMDLPEMHLDMVRAGIILYGLWASPEVDMTKMVLKPALSLKARISYVKWLEHGESISYCRNYYTEGRRKIATLPIGFADGFNRLLSGKADVLLNGRRVPQVGNICMDQCMIDVTDINDVKIGDEVVLFGSGLPIEEMAEIRGTVTYEIISNLSRRIPKVYFENGKIVKIVDYLKYTENS